MVAQVDPCAAGLVLTGERTVPGIAVENYWFRRHEAAYQWLRGAVDLRGATVVDAGSGEGYGAASLRAAGAAAVVALEFDETAGRHCARAYPDVDTVRANLDSIPLASGCVDVVVTMQVIEHLWDLRRFLAECRRILRPGGLIVAATPNRVTFSPGLGRGSQPTNPFHVEEFDAEQVRGMLSAAGFEDVSVLGVHHADRIAADLVPRQIAAALHQDWPVDLLAEVAAVTIEDFSISAEHVGTSLDLIGIGRAPEPVDA